jgi:hypothetical protein
MYAVLIVKRGKFPAVYRESKFRRDFPGPKIT